jgi:hypothetical protein
MLDGVLERHLRAEFGAQRLIVGVGGLLQADHPIDDRLLDGDGGFVLDKEKRLVAHVSLEREIDDIVIVCDHIVMIFIVPDVEPHRWTRLHAASDFRQPE